MLNGRVVRVLGMGLLVDGLRGLIFGRVYASGWLIGRATSPCYRAVGWLARPPDWLVRGLGATEAGLGVTLVARAPVGVGELYGAWSRFYDPVSFVWRRWLYADLHRAFDEALGTHLPATGRVLDLGCGTGANLERLLALDLPFGSYLGVDLSEHMLARARARFGTLPNAAFQQLNLLADPLPEGPFDLVVSTWVFSHLPDPERVLEKALGRLQPGGHVVLLFLAETGTWLDRLADPALGFFNSRPLSETVFRHFPNPITIQRFGGGTAALVVLQEPGGGGTSTEPSSEAGFTGRRQLGRGAPDDGHQRHQTQEAGT